MSLWPAQADAASAARTAPRRRPRNCSVLRQHRTSPSVLSASVTSACGWRHKAVPQLSTSLSCSRRWREIVGDTSPLVLASGDDMSVNTCKWSNQSCRAPAARR